MTTTTHNAETKTFRQMTIGVDLDGTTGNYEEALRIKLGKLLGINPSKFDDNFPAVGDYAMWNNGWTGIDTKEKYFDLHSKAVQLGLFEDMIPYDNAARVLWRFHEQGHFLRIITARFLKPGDRYKVVESTAKFCDKHDIPIDDIAFTERKTEIEADVYIDDSPSNIAKLTAAGKTVIIYDQSYNAGLEGLRAKTWLEVEEIINRLAEES